MNIREKLSVVLITIVISVQLVFNITDINKLENKVKHLETVVSALTEETVKSAAIGNKIIDVHYEWLKVIDKQFESDPNAVIFWKVRKMHLQDKLYNNIWEYNFGGIKCKVDIENNTKIDYGK